MSTLVVPHFPKESSVPGDDRHDLGPKSTVALRWWGVCPCGDSWSDHTETGLRQTVGCPTRDSEVLTPGDQDLRVSVQGPLPKSSPDHGVCRPKGSVLVGGTGVSQYSVSGSARYSRTPGTRPDSRVPLPRPTLSTPPVLTSGVGSRDRRVSDSTETVSTG